MTAYDLDSGKEMIPVDHIFYADENYQPVSPENAVYIEYIRIFEKDNKPDGDIFTEEGIQWAGNLLICEDNRVIESFEADADQLLPGKKATLTAVAADGVKLTWSLAEGDKDYATLKVGKNNTATVTAKKNKQIRDIKVTVSAVVDGRTESKSVTIEILPVVSQVEIRTPDQTVINGETAIFYMDQQDASQNVFQVIAVCAPAEAVQDVTWKSSDAKSVSVDENGVITALVPGKTVTITATATDGSGKKATFKVKTSYAVESIRLSGSEVCAVGKTISLTAEVLPENATNKKLVWSIIGEDGLPVSKNEIASISNGKLKGLAAGEVTVRATWEEWVDVYAEWTVTILPVVKQVDILNEEDEIITKKTVELRMSTTGDNTMQLYAVNSPEGAAQSVTWKSANTKVATVDENGLVTALVPGKTVKITATATDGSGKNSSVTVKTVQPMENVFISGSSVAAKGKTITLTADIFPANTTNKKLVWSVVEGSEYATVSNGKLKVGKNVPDGETVTVRVQWAEDESIYDEWTVTLYAVAASKVLILDEAGEALTGTQTVIMSTEGENTLCLGYEVQKAEAAQEVAWKSSNVRYATVDENGVVTVLVPGKVATITATAADGSGKKTTIKVKGVQPVEELTLAENLVLDETGNLFIAGGKSLKLAPAVIVNPSNPSNKKLDWKIQENGKLVTKTAAASISTSGVLTAKKVTEPVTVTVVATAKDGYGATIAFDVTIYPATTKVTLWFDAYDLTGKTLEVFAATQIQLEAKSQPENGAQKYTWKSSNEKYVTVDENGLVTLRDGLGKTVTITATAADGSGKKATMKITFSAEENMVPIG